MVSLKATFSYLDDTGEVQTTIISDLTKGKKTIIFAIPGAFTPTCLQKHAQQSAKLKAKGMDRITCDAFVMKVWKKDLLKVNDEVLLPSDGNGTFTKAIECELNVSAAARIQGCSVERLLVTR
ncbi:peroxiredoxin-2E, chloroplastic-like [Arachis stenosperma]|uniref:peroxiredoxin-2E, chloroplastic-like n=1 Tax=Arachis stenosperma TaxID=217475 RepID=UPI0025AD8F7D|nr:peroxiredoxin-2E, chloroplastic-like [Arachis stenosperma]